MSIECLFVKLPLNEAIRVLKRLVFASEVIVMVWEPSQSQDKLP